MTQFAPLDPFSSDDEQGIPAADPGPGAPQTAEGYGAGAEEPDRPEQGDRDQGDRDQGDRDQGDGDQGDRDREALEPESTPFTTPDPDDVSRT
jgi:hypothetical protein